MKTLTFILSLSICLCKININNPSIELMRDIPIDDTKIDAIIDYIDYSNGIDNIYELLEINQINATDVQILKKYVSVQDSDISEFIKNQKMSSYKLEWWFASDGNQEGLSDIWLDRFFFSKRYKLDEL